MKADSKKERKILVNTKGTPISNKKNREKIEEKLIRKEQIKYPHTPMVQEKVGSWLKELKVLKEQLKYPQSPMKVIKGKEEKEKGETSNSLTRVKNPHRKAVKKTLFDEEMREAEENWEGLENALAQHDY